MGVARGDIALLRRGLESWMLVAKPTLEQITDIAMKTSTSVNSILRFFKLPVPLSVNSSIDFNLAEAAQETAVASEL